MWPRIRDRSGLGKLIARFDQLPARDRRALSLLMVALLLAVLYFVLWQPASGFYQSARASHDNAAELVAWMQASQPQLQTLAASGRGDKPTDRRALIALVTRLADEEGLELQRFEPSGEQGVRLWLEPAAFPELAVWLERLTKDHGVIVDQAGLDRGDAPGTVTARLTLAI